MWDLTPYEPFLIPFLLPSPLKDYPVHDRSQTWDPFSTTSLRRGTSRWSRRPCYDPWRPPLRVQCGTCHVRYPWSDPVAWRVWDPSRHIWGEQVRPTAAPHDKRTDQDKFPLLIEVCSNCVVLLIFPFQTNSERKSRVIRVCLWWWKNRELTNKRVPFPYKTESFTREIHVKD